jgi:hypothetical protein
MREIPILFSTPMVKAILEGRKTQTRRVIKYAIRNTQGDFLNARYEKIKPPYGQPGDILWVRETWADLRGMGFDTPFAYLANSINKHGEEDGDSKRCRLDYGVKWKPSIHMPREACRLFLKVKSIRVERLQEITPEDCYKEGVTPSTNPAYDTRQSYLKGFSDLWNSIYKNWAENPFVWAVEFEKVKP